MGNEATLLAACHPRTLLPAAAAPAIPPSRPAPVTSRCHSALPERISSPWLGKKPDSSQPGPG